MLPGSPPAGRNHNLQCKARVDRRFFLGRIAGLAWLGVPGRKTKEMLAWLKYLGLSFLKRLHLPAVLMRGPAAFRGFDRIFGSTLIKGVPALIIKAFGQCVLAGYLALCSKPVKPLGQFPL